MVSRISLGSKKPQDELRKEIDINVTPKHLVVFFLILIVLSIAISIVLAKYTTIGSETLSFKCNDGTVETITPSKEYYCGQHYSELKGLLPEQKYLKVEELINNGQN